jgi:hypothetical protein
VSNIPLAPPPSRRMNLLHDTVHLVSQVYLFGNIYKTAQLSPIGPLIFIVYGFDVVWIPDRKFGEGDLRLQHRSLAVDIVALPELGCELITHGNILSIVVPVLLKRGHPANAIVIPLQVPGFEIMVPRAIVMSYFAK